MLPRLKVQVRAFRSFLCATRGGVTVWGFEPNERPFLTLRRLARPVDRNALQGCGFHHATRMSSEAFRRRFFSERPGTKERRTFFPLLCGRSVLPGKRRTGGGGSGFRPERVCGRGPCGVERLAAAAAVRLAVRSSRRCFGLRRLPGPARTVRSHRLLRMQKGPEDASPGPADVPRSDVTSLSRCLPTRGPLQAARGGR